MAKKLLFLDEAFSLGKNLITNWRNRKSGLILRCLLSVIAGQEGVGRTCKNLEFRVDFRPVSSLGGTFNGE